MTEGEAERGVSNVVGIALLVAIAITGAVLVVVLGGQAAEDIEQQGRMQVAEQSMREVASRLNGLQSSGGQMSATFTLPKDLEGEIRMVRETTINMTANRNAYTGTCTTGPIEIGTILYENKEGQTVGYEAGGVFRGSAENGTVVVSGPSLNYRNGRLQLAFSNISGGMSAGQKIVGELNQSRSQVASEHIMNALLSNKTIDDFQSGTNLGNVVYQCANPELTNVTINITGSRYASGWHQFAHRNYDDRRVTVRPGENADVDGGDRVTIRFSLGRTSQAEYVAENLADNESVPEDRDVQINATIRNRGGLRGTQDVRLNLFEKPSMNNVTGAARAIHDVTLEGTRSQGANNTVNVSFQIDDSYLENGGNIDATREYLYTINTSGGVARDTFTVGHENAVPPNFKVTSVSAPASADLDDNPTVQATIENDHSGFCPGPTPCTMPDTQEVLFKFEGREIATQEVTLTRGGSTTVSFEIPTYREGTGLGLNISTEDTYDDSQTIDLGDAATFRIDGHGMNRSNPAAGETIGFGARIENTGNLAGDLCTRRVRLRIYDSNNQTTGHGTTWYNSSDAECNPTEEIGDGNIKSLGPYSTSISSPGDYSYQILTPTEKTGQIPFRVGSTTKPYYQVNEVTVEPDPADLNGTSEIEINASVTNYGGTVTQPGYDQTIEFSFNGNPPFETFSRNVSAGESWAPATPLPDRNIQSLSPGTYPVTVSTENTSIRTTVEIKNTSANQSEGNGTVDPCPEIEGSDCTQVVAQGVLVHLQVIGTEYTSYDENIFTDNKEYRAPTEMELVIENRETGERETTPIIGPNTDINAPQYQEDQKERAENFNYTVRIPPNQTYGISVFATSYDCSGQWEATVEEVINGEEADIHKCNRYFNEDISISSEENSGNLLVLQDGDTVPSISAAAESQRSINDMLGPLVDPSSGELDLEEGQVIFLYELSAENASPSEAGGGVDYNDAVVLFETLRQTERRTGNPDPGSAGTPNLQITGMDAPSRIDAGDDATVRVNVTNVGTAPWGNATDVRLYVDGNVQTTETVSPLAAGEHEWVAFNASEGDFDTGPGPIAGTVPPDSYNFTAQLVEDEAETTQRNIYIGDSPDQPYYLPNIAPTSDYTSRPNTGFIVDLRVENVGNASEDSNGQSLSETVEQTTGGVSVSNIDDVSIGNLTPGQTTSENIGATLGNDQTGTVTLNFSTENASVTHTVTVGRPNFTVACIWLGAQCIGGQTVLSDPGISSLRVVLHNDGAVDGSRTVQLNIDENDDNAGSFGDHDYEKSPSSSPSTINLASGASTDLTFDFPISDTGVHAYNLTVRDGSNVVASREGRIEITNSTSAIANTNSTSSDLISVDMNMVVVDASE